MLNQIVKFLTGKEIIFYREHRNSRPIAKANRDKYFFFNPYLFWKAFGLVGRRRKLRYRLMYGFLTFVNPKYILDINWHDKIESLYLVWCNNNRRHFIVVQHGIYYGGIMRDIGEKYIKCNILLVWGDYFKSMYEGFNPGKSYQCIVFGNPVYNEYTREEFRYRDYDGKKVLIAVSLIKGKRLKTLYRFLDKLEHLGFDITVKEHAQQASRSESITGYKTRSGYLYPLLKDQEYDIVVTDVSSAMTDIIFFKNKALYFSPEDEGADLNRNIYSEFLENTASHFISMNNAEDLINFIDISAQENLLKYLIKTENLSNNLEQLTPYVNGKIGRNLKFKNKKEEVLT